MALDGIERINSFIGKLTKRSPKADASSGVDFRDVLYESEHKPVKNNREGGGGGDSVDISRDASKLARYAQELQSIRAALLNAEGRGEFISDGNPRYLEDTARAYNILREIVAQKFPKSPAALSAELEILNVVLERSVTEEARELAQSQDVHMFSMYITHGEAMLRERLWNINGKYLISFFYLLNTMDPDRAEEAASNLLRKVESPSLEMLSYNDITRLKAFGRRNKSLSLAAKWNMLSTDKELSPVLRDHFAMLYRHQYGVQNANKAAARSSGDIGEIASPSHRAE